jgi:rod shape-determining protein MreD
MILLLIPALTVIIATLIAILPFGAGDMVRTCLSFLPLMTIHYWSARRPHLVPVAVVFVVGLIIDVLTHGPVGFWALLALTAAGTAQIETAATGQSTTAGRAAVFALTMVLAAGLCWAIASLYTGQTIDVQPFLVAALTAVALYPLMAVLLMPIDRLWDTQRSRLFMRGT